MPGKHTPREKCACRSKRCCSLLFAGVVILASSLADLPAYALSYETREKFAQNNIVFYNPEGHADNCLSINYGNVSINIGDLPASTVASLEANGVKEKAGANIDLYTYAADKTGLPWQAIAALHFEEASMRRGRSISNGQEIKNTAYKNVDNITIYPDEKKDAEEAGKHLIEMAKWAYDVDLLSSPTPDDWANAFLSYNRGKMYSCDNKTFDESPYVMNGFDDDHLIPMTFLWADSNDRCTGKHYNSLAGKKAYNPGALAVFYYLGGFDDTTSSSQKASSKSSSSSSSSSTTSAGSSGKAGDAASGEKGTLLPNHTEVTFFNDKTVIYNANNYVAAEGMAAIRCNVHGGGCSQSDENDPDLNMGDVIYVETTDDTSQEGSAANGKYLYIADLGGLGGNLRIDVWADFRQGKKGCPPLTG